MNTNFTKLDQVEKDKNNEQICVWNPMSTGLIM